MNVSRKVYVLVVNGEKQKMKQQSLFGGIVKDNTKFYCIYKNPDGDFEYVVEWFAYRKRRKLGRKTRSWLLRHINFGRKSKQMRERLKSS